MEKSSPTAFPPSPVFPTVSPGESIFVMEEESAVAYHVYRTVDFSHNHFAWCISLNSHCLHFLAPKRERIRHIRVFRDFLFFLFLASACGVLLWIVNASAVQHEVEMFTNIQREKINGKYLWYFSWWIYL